MLARREEEEIWVSISVELPLPMGVGVDADNVITHVVNGGHAAADRCAEGCGLSMRRRLQPICVAEGCSPIHAAEGCNPVSGGQLPPGSGGCGPVC